MFGFAIFCQKNISAKAARKRLMKLTKLQGKNNLALQFFSSISDILISVKFHHQTGNLNWLICQ